MPLEEPITYRDWIEVWKLTNAGLWEHFADSEGNEKRLLEGAEKYGRPCRDAVDRSFNEIRASLVRTDCKTEDDGCCEEEVDTHSRLRAPACSPTPAP
jgi:hypothetical protein